MKSSIIVGTRGSKLALAQTNQVIEKLKNIHPNLEINIKIIKTTGDITLDKSLSKIGGKGLFIKEIEDALDKKEIDFAVHSMKDIPHTIAECFQIGAVLTRENPSDVLISRNNFNLEEMPVSAIIGTSSLRRVLQLKNLRPDLKFEPLRGNIDSRIDKLAHAKYDGIILAAAGIKRLGWTQENNKQFFKNITKNKNTDLNVEYLNTEIFIPAVGQGAIALEIRKNDTKILDIIKVLHNNDDAIRIASERAFLREIDGGCEIPVGAYATLNENELTIIGFIGDEEKLTVFKDKITGNKDFNRGLGIELARRIRRSMEL